MQSFLASLHQQPEGIHSGTIDDDELYSECVDELLIVMYAFFGTLAISMINLIVMYKLWGCTYLKLWVGTAAAAAAGAGSDRHLIGICAHETGMYRSKKLHMVTCYFAGAAVPNLVMGVVLLTVLYPKHCDMADNVSVFISAPASSSAVSSAARSAPAS
jgi:hypothetical protein